MAIGGAAVNLPAIVQQLIIDTSNISAATRQGESAMGRLATTMASTGARLGSYVSLPLAAGVAASIKSFSELEKRLNLVAEIASDGSKSFKQFEQKAIELGKAVDLPGVTAMDAAKAMETLAKAGFNTSSTLAGAKGALQFMVAAEMDAETATNLLANALITFNLGADQAERAANSIVAGANAATMSAQQLATSLRYAGLNAETFGLSLEETIAGIGVLSNAGLQGSIAGTQFRMMLQKLVSPSEKAKKVIEELGIKTRDAQNNMLPLNTIIKQLWAAFAKAPEQTQNEAFMEFFADKEQFEEMRSQFKLTGDELDDLNNWFEVRAGSGMRGFINSIQKQGTGVGKSYEEMVNEVKNNTGELKRVLEAQMKGVNGNIEIFKNQWDTLLIGMGRALKEPIKDILDFGSSIAAWFNNLSEASQNTAGKIVLIAIAAGPVLIALSLLMRAVRGIFGPMGKLLAFTMRNWGVGKGTAAGAMSSTAQSMSGVASGASNATRNMGPLRQALQNAQTPAERLATALQRIVRALAGMPAAVNRATGPLSNLAATTGTAATNVQTLAQSGQARNATRNRAQPAPAAQAQPAPAATPPIALRPYPQKTAGSRSTDDLAALRAGQSQVLQGFASIEQAAAAAGGYFVNTMTQSTGKVKAIITTNLASSMPTAAAAGLTEAKAPFAELSAYIAQTLARGGQEGWALFKATALSQSAEIRALWTAPWQQAMRPPKGQPGAGKFMGVEAMQKSILSYEKVKTEMLAKLAQGPEAIASAWNMHVNSDNKYSKLFVQAVRRNTAKVSEAFGERQTKMMSNNALNAMFNPQKFALPPQVTAISKMNNSMFTKIGQGGSTPNANAVAAVTTSLKSQVAVLEKGLPSAIKAGTASWDMLRNKQLQVLGVMRTVNQSAAVQGQVDMDRARKLASAQTVVVQRRTAQFINSQTQIAKATGDTQLAQEMQTKAYELLTERKVIAEQLFIDMLSATQLAIYRNAQSAEQAAQRQIAAAQAGLAAIERSQAAVGAGGRMNGMLALPAGPSAAETKAEQARILARRNAESLMRDMDRAEKHVAKVQERMVGSTISAEERKQRAIYKSHLQQKKLLTDYSAQMKQQAAARQQYAQLALTQPTSFSNMGLGSTQQAYKMSLGEFQRNLKAAGGDAANFRNMLKTMVPPEALRQMRLGTYTMGELNMFLTTGQGPLAKYTALTLENAQAQQRLAGSVNTTTGALKKQQIQQQQTMGAAGKAKGMGGTAANLGMMAAFGGSMLAPAVGGSAGAVLGGASTGAMIGMIGGPKFMAAGAILGGIIALVRELTKTRKDAQEEMDSLFSQTARGMEWWDKALQNAKDSLKASTDSLKKSVYEQSEEGRRAARKQEETRRLIASLPSSGLKEINEAGRRTMMEWYKGIQSVKLDDAMQYAENAKEYFEAYEKVVKSTLDDIEDKIRTHAINIANIDIKYVDLFADLRKQVKDVEWALKGWQNQAEGLRRRYEPVIEALKKQIENLNNVETPEEKIAKAKKLLIKNDLRRQMVLAGENQTLRAGLQAKMDLVDADLELIDLTTERRRLTNEIEQIPLEEKLKNEEAALNAQLDPIQAQIDATQDRLDLLNLQTEQLERQRDLEAEADERAKNRLDLYRQMAQIVGEANRARGESVANGNNDPLPDANNAAPTNDEYGFDTSKLRGPAARPEGGINDYLGNARSILEEFNAGKTLDVAEKNIKIVAEMLYKAQVNGVGANTALAGMKSIIKKLSTEKGRKELEKMGISLTDLSGTFTRVNGQMIDTTGTYLDDFFAQINSNQLTTTDAVALFGQKGTKTYRSFASDASTSIEELRKKWVEVDNVIKATSDSVTKAKGAFGEIHIARAATNIRKSMGYGNSKNAQDAFYNLADADNPYSANTNFEKNHQMMNDVRKRVAALFAGMKEDQLKAFNEMNKQMRTSLVKTFSNLEQSRITLKEKIAQYAKAGIAPIGMTVAEAQSKIDQILAGQQEKIAQAMTGDPAKVRERMQQISNETITAVARISPAIAANMAVGQDQLNLALDGVAPEVKARLALIDPALGEAMATLPQTAYTNGNNARNGFVGGVQPMTDDAFKQGLATVDQLSSGLSDEAANKKIEEAAKEAAERYKRGWLETIVNFFTSNEQGSLPSRINNGIERLINATQGRGWITYDQYNSRPVTGKEKGGILKFAQGGVYKSNTGGGITKGMMAVIGEGSNPREFVIPTDKRYRQRALMLLQQAMQEIGLPSKLAGGKISADVGLRLLLDLQTDSSKGEAAQLASSLNRTLAKSLCAGATGALQETIDEGFVSPEALAAVESQGTVVGRALAEGINDGFKSFIDPAVSLALLKAVSNISPEMQNRYASRASDVNALPSDRFVQSGIAARRGPEQPPVIYNTVNLNVDKMEVRNDQDIVKISRELQRLLDRQERFSGSARV